MPLPIHRLPFGASTLNRMVPATIEASDASVNTMPCRLSVPTDMRCQTMKLTPAMPSSSPTTLRQVSASPRNSRREHGGEHRIGADDQAAEAGRDRLQPGIAEPEIERVVGDAEDGEDAGHRATTADQLRRGAP